MLKRTTAVAIAIMIAMVAGPVAAQTCSVGLYSDASGSSSLVSPTVGVVFDVYAILFTEGLANAVGYTLVPDLGPDLLATGATYGPNGGGINIPNDSSDPIFSGQNVGLGVCAVGFDGVPIQVAKYSFVALGPNVGPASGVAATIGVTGNARSSDLDPTVPVVSDCNGNLSSCDIGPSLVIEPPVSEGAESFGAVKSLFRN